MVKMETNAIHPDAIIYQPVATPHQPGLPVPKCCQSRQLPPGGSQEEVAGADTIPCTHLFRERRGAKSPYPLQIFNSCKSPIRPQCVRTNRDEKELTTHPVSGKIKLGRMHTTTHGRTSRRLYLELKTVCKSVLEPPFQAQISGTLSPYTKDCFNTR